MNGRKYAKDMLSILDTLGGYLPQENIYCYTADEFIKIFYAQAQFHYSNEITVEAQSALDELGRRMMIYLKDEAAPKNAQSKIRKDYLENALVQAFYSYYTEITITHDELMSIEKPANIIFAECKKNKFFEKGEGGAQVLSMDCNREVTICEKKIKETNKETIEIELNNVIKNEKLTKNLIQAYSQHPSYVLIKLVGASLEENNMIMFSQPKFRKTNVEVIDENTYLHFDMLIFPTRDLKTSKALNNLGAASATFKYAEHGLLSKEKGFDLIEVSTSDPFIINALLSGKQFTMEEMFKYCNHDNYVAQKIKSGDATIKELDNYIEHYSLLLLNDIRQHIFEISTNTGSVLINKLIKLNAGHFVSLEDISKLCNEHLEAKSPQFSQMFTPTKNVNRDPHTELLYQTLANIPDILHRYDPERDKEKFTSLQQLIIAYQKILIHKMFINEFDRLAKLYTDKEKIPESMKSIVDTYQYLIIYLQTSPLLEPWGDIQKKYADSPLKDDKFFQEVSAATLEPKQVIEKHLQTPTLKSEKLFAK